MMITIKVYPVAGDGAPQCIARGYMPSGQELIQSSIHATHDPASQSAAVKEVSTWIHANRPGWNIEIDGPTLQPPDTLRPDLGAGLAEVAMGRNEREGAR
jgi:hypothetical protein